MIAEVRWSARARREFSEAMEYIAEERPMVARTLRNRLFERIEQLGEHPMRGRPGPRPGMRELVLTGTPFLAVYVIRKDGLIILRFLHGRRDRSRS